MTSQEIRAKRIRNDNSLGGQLNVAIEVMLEIAAQLAEANEREATAGYLSNTPPASRC
ncbi:MAG TPA: hypothetical protein VKR60_06300 [Candidatus Sulfotelmatobacter sp.]|nr:hypothetical protein [Candidatus Sulfotelmatobacter sp.]